MNPMLNSTTRGTLALAMAVAISGAACAGKHKGPGRVYDATNGFSIAPPADWTHEPPAMGNFMVLFGPVELTHGQPFTVNFNVNLQQDRTPVEAMLPVVKAALAKIMTNYKPIEEGFVTIDGHKSMRVTSQYQQGVATLQALQYGVPNGKGPVYVMTFTAPAESMEKYRPLFQDMALSARVD